ncbi:MAG TPA: hypothetical protein VMT53_21435 [Terriglobales bacterium]|nr:hypothetical protein [Terriglobales bacterium]
MRNTVSMWIVAMMFISICAVSSAFAAPAPAPRGALVVTGCLQQGPLAKEYLLTANDNGTVWGVTSADRDMYLNTYVGKTVTITGSAESPSALHVTRASSEKDAGATHFLKGSDVLVESETCQK